MELMSCLREVISTSSSMWCETQWFVLCVGAFSQSCYVEGVCSLHFFFHISLCCCGLFWVKNEWEMKDEMNDGGDSLSLFVLRLNWRRKDNGHFSHLVISWRKRNEKKGLFEMCLFGSTMTIQTHPSLSHIHHPLKEKGLWSCVFVMSEQKKTIVQSRTKHSLANLIKWRSWMWILN